MPGDTELLTEIRDLLRLIAEPALAKRDSRLRSALGQIIGTSQRKADAVALMDGTRSQAEIGKLCGWDTGNMSRLVGALRKDGLIQGDDKHLKLSFPMPANLLDIAGGA